MTYPYTAPTRNEPVRNRLGDYGVSFPVGQVIIITDGEARVTEALTDPDHIMAADDGTGDFGKSIFRRGRTYSVNETEKDILVAAGLMEEPA